MSSLIVIAAPTTMQARVALLQEGYRYDWNWRWQFAILINTSYGHDMMDHESTATTNYCQQQRLRTCPSMLLLFILLDLHSLVLYRTLLCLWTLYTGCLLFQNVIIDTILITYIIIHTASCGFTQLGISSQCCSWTVTSAIIISYINRLFGYHRIILSIQFTITMVYHHIPYMQLVICLMNDSVNVGQYI